MRKDVEDTLGQYGAKAIAVDAQRQSGGQTAAQQRQQPGKGLLLVGRSCRLEKHAHAIPIRLDYAKAEIVDGDRGGNPLPVLLQISAVPIPGGIDRRRLYVGRKSR